MICVGRTKQSHYLRRCARPATQWLFCRAHVWQPFALLLLLVSLSGFTLRDVIKRHPTNALNLLVGRTSLSAGDSCTVVFGVEHLDRPSVLTLPLSVHNPTSRTVRDVSVLVTYPEDLIRPWPSTSPSQTDGLGMLRNLAPERETHTAGGVSTSAIYLKKISAHSSVFVGEPVVWTRAYLQYISASVVPTVRLHVKVSADDFEPRTWALWVMGVAADSDTATARAYHHVTSIRLRPRAVAVFGHTAPTVVAAETLYCDDGFVTRFWALDAEGTASP